jgi:ubiquinone/menaquinone biosynthesis C-methylase UbiE
MIHYLLLILMMITFLIIFSKPTFHVPSSHKQIVPYSEEHVPLYEIITYKPDRYTYELNIVQSHMTTSSHVLDVGSGLGYHVNQLNESGIHTVGVDSSKAMIRHSKKYPYTFIHGNVMSASIFPEHSFTHIMCLYYTIYCILDKETFLNNLHHWLIEDGILFIHGVHEWKYEEPIVGQLTYESSLQKSMFKEKITYDQQSYVVHHIIYMISKQELIQLAKKCHFTLIHEYSYSHNYILVFKSIYDSIQSY